MATSSKKYCNLIIDNTSYFYKTTLVFNVAENSVENFAIPVSYIFPNTDKWQANAVWSSTYNCYIGLIADSTYSYILSYINSYYGKEGGKIIIDNILNAYAYISYPTLIVDLTYLHNDNGVVYNSDKQEDIWVSSSPSNSKKSYMYVTGQVYNGKGTVNINIPTDENITISEYINSASNSEYYEHVFLASYLPDGENSKATYACSIKCSCGSIEGKNAIYSEGKYKFLSTVGTITQQCDSTGYVTVNLTYLSTKDITTADFATRISQDDFKYEDVDIRRPKVTQLPGRNCFEVKCYPYFKNNAAQAYFKIDKSNFLQLEKNGSANYNISIVDKEKSKTFTYGTSNAEIFTFTVNSSIADRLIAKINKISTENSDYKIVTKTENEVVTKKVNLATAYTPCKYSLTYSFSYVAADDFTGADMYAYIKFEPKISILNNASNLVNVKKAIHGCHQEFLGDINNDDIYACVQEGWAEKNIYLAVSYSSYLDDIKLVCNNIPNGCDVYYSCTITPRYRYSNANSENSLENGLSDKVKESGNYEQKDRITYSNNIEEHTTYSTHIYVDATNKYAYYIHYANTVEVTSYAFNSYSVMDKKYEANFTIPTQNTLASITSLTYYNVDELNTNSTYIYNPLNIKLSSEIESSDLWIYIAEVHYKETDNSDFELYTTTSLTGNDTIPLFFGNYGYKISIYGCPRGLYGQFKNMKHILKEFVIYNVNSKGIRVNNINNINISADNISTGTIHNISNRYPSILSISNNNISEGNLILYELNIYNSSNTNIANVCFTNNLPLTEQTILYNSYYTYKITIKKYSKENGILKEDKYIKYIGKINLATSSFKADIKDSGAKKWVVKKASKLSDNYDASNIYLLTSRKTDNKTLYSVWGPGPQDADRFTYFTPCGVIGDDGIDAAYVSPFTLRDCTIKDNSTLSSMKNNQLVTADREDKNNYIFKYNSCDIVYSDIKELLENL